jgi:hypothetical protein
MWLVSFLFWLGGPCSWVWCLGEDPTFSALHSIVLSIRFLTLWRPVFFPLYLSQIINLTIRDGRHAKHRQNGRGVLYTPWGVFILYNATSQF